MENNSVAAPQYLDFDVESSRESISSNLGCLALFLATNVALMGLQGPLELGSLTVNAWWAAGILAAIGLLALALRFAINDRIRIDPTTRKVFSLSKFLGKESLTLLLHFDEIEAIAVAVDRLSTKASDRASDGNRCQYQSVFVTKAGLLSPITEWRRHRSGFEAALEASQKVASLLQRQCHAPQYTDELLLSVKNHGGNVDISYTEPLIDRIASAKLF